MKKFFVAEILCVVAALAFIFVTVKDCFVTDKDAAQLADAVALMLDEGLTERNSIYTSEHLGVDVSSFTSFRYYSSDDVMNVCELFIGVLNDYGDTSVQDTITSYSEERYNLFNGYAPKEAELLENCIIDIKSGVVIFCVSNNADAIYNLICQTV